MITAPALNAAAEARPAPVVEQCFLWQPAVAEHALTDDPERDPSPLGHEHFPGVGGRIHSRAIRASLIRGLAARLQREAELAHPAEPQARGEAPPLPPGAARPLGPGVPLRPRGDRAHPRAPGGAVRSKPRGAQ